MNTPTTSNHPGNPTNNPTPITIDSRERDAAYVALLGEKHLITIRTLPVGDIIIHDLGIERKTIDDLFFTLQEGRLFSQLRELKRQDIREPSAPRRPRPRNPLFALLNPALLMLTAIPGIGAKHACALLEHFGTVDKVLTASAKDLRKVRGIGKEKAAQIARVNGGKESSTPG